MRDTATVLAGNQKGGVGKTTLAVHLAAALAELGLRVLLIDLDVNCCATAHFGVPLDLVGSLEVLTGERSALSVVRTHEGEPGLPPGLDLIPSSRMLESLQRILDRRTWSKPLDCLRAPLAEIRAEGRYDVVLLDTPPNLSIPTQASYLEADFVLAALTTDPGSRDGLRRVLEDVVELRSRSDLNPRLELLGAVLGLVDGRTVPGQTYAETYRSDLAAAGFAGALFETQVPKAVAHSRAWDAGCSLFQWDPRHPALEAWRALARETLARMRRPIPRRPVPAAAAPVHTQP